jgi:hypothetical protein
MKRIITPMILAFSLTGAGCKKDKDTKPVCQLTVITPDRGGVANLYYDDQGRLNMMRISDREIKYEYRSDSIIATETKSLGFYQRLKYKMNANGLPLSIRQEINITGSQWFQRNFEYNGTEVTKTVTSSSANSGTQTYEYSWNNGNLAKVVEGPNEWKYEYYTDKERVQGDGFLIEMISLSGSIAMYTLNGAIEIVRNRNLLKKMEHTLLNTGSYSISYEYDADKDGKIEKAYMLNSNSNIKTQLDYQYQCK